MSIGNPVAADCPSIFDVIINGQGYIFLRTIDTSLPFRTQRALYARTPTFLERTNVGPGYSDNQQDFFLTFSQNDWAGGEQQRFVHLGDPDTLDKTWRLEYADNTVPGQVSMRKDTSVTAMAAITTLTPNGSSLLYGTTASNLWEIAATSTTDRGAHGLGVAPKTIVTDSSGVYMSAEGGASVGVRRWNGAFTTFSATAADKLWFHNNTLYGFQNSPGIFSSYSSAGASTTIYSWKTAAGGVESPIPQAFASLGGKLVFVLYTSRGCELYQYDGTAVSLLHQFPLSFYCTSLAVSQGVLFLGGSENRLASGTNTSTRGVIYYYANGTVGKLWDAITWVEESGTTQRSDAAVVSFDGGVLFTDQASSRLLYYNLNTGSISGVGAYTFSTSDSTALLGATQYFSVLKLTNGTNIYRYPAISTTAATSTTITSSLIDFDNSLTKQMRGIKVDFVVGSDGNGGTVDIAYRVNDLDSTYTTLQTGATSGTEYTLSGISGRSISVKITLNRGTSTFGPVLKRVYVRASPMLQSFRKCEYILDLSGVNGNSPVILNDNNTPHPLDGLSMATNLNTAITASSTISITDRFGTITGVIEPGSTEIIEIAPEEYIARVAVREV